VIEHDNLNYLQNKPKYRVVQEKYAHLHKATKAAASPPGLKVGDPLHYSAMMQRICNAYNERFC